VKALGDKNGREIREVVENDREGDVEEEGGEPEGEGGEED
jgi:hypothetical protein